MTHLLSVITVASASALALALAGAGIAAHQDPPRQDQQPRPTFRTAVDLVPVDVNVIDRDGRPVDNLEAGDFVLTVDGKPRRIASAEFIRLGGDSTPRPATPPYYSTNAHAAGGRLVMLVIDQGNISAGRGKFATEAAARFISRLNPSDRVGLFAIPGAGPQINFTANHALVLTMLKNIVGQATPDLGQQRVGISEAAKLDRGDRLTLDAIIDRECPGSTGPDRAICVQSLETEARTVFADMRDRTRNSIVSLRYIMERLAETSSPKTVVYLAEGLIIDRELSDLMWITPLASKGRVALYVLQLVPPLSDASAPRISPSRNEDMALAEEGLSVMAGLTGGTVFRVVSSADYAFNRLTVELSAYYLLSFEPEPGDRDGKTHKIKIQVPSRRGIEVRARQEFAVEAVGARTDEHAIAETLRAPLLATDIGLKVSSYTFREPNSQKLRILIAADIDRSQNASGVLALGYALVDARGGLVASQYEPVLKTPVRNRTQQFVAAATADAPGVYVLKLAVVDDSGKRGSVEHAIRAQLTSAGQIRATDLLIAENAGTAAALTPAIAAEFTADQLNGYLELYSDAPEVLESATVTLEVADGEDARALDSAAARFNDAAGAAGKRVAEGTVPIALLPPGDYVARAIISIGGRKAGQVTRPFRIARAAPSAAAATPGSATAGLRPRPALPFASRIDAFDRGSVLTPAVVGFFLDRLNVGNRTAAPAAAVDHARAGRFDAALEAASAGNNQLASVFLNGLALYAKGDLDPAAEKFRESLRIDWEFFPAAFYLGACYAAAGRDRDAAAAWQTSLVTESDAPFIYTLLGDALLRQRQMDQAVDILKEASKLWPDNEQVQLRLGTALAMDGKAAEALTVLDPYLAKHPEDHERHFVAMRTIYEAHAAGRTVGTRDEDRARFERYATAYVAAGGPQTALVEQWRRFLKR